jgi:LmbE family N-acetylglucosaminyl deacetylase
VNVLFLIAHPDDEAYGPYGTLAKASAEHNVTVCCLCDGRRPGSEEVADSRTGAFMENCKRLGAEWRMWSNPDLGLTYNDTVTQVIGIIEHFKPDIVYTHNISDLNNDHRMVAEAALVACRPKPASTVKELYFFEIPSSTDWTFSQVQPTFEPNVYVDVTDYMDDKKLAMQRYTTETYPFPDARSIEAMETLSKYRGYQVGVNNAEALKLVFKRI